MSFIPGANVGPYRIVEQAEGGELATTYTAYQPSEGRYVSIVAVPTMDRDDLSLLRQYQRQIELISEIRHPNLLTVLDHGEYLGVPFVVYERLEAEPLSERLGAPWPLDEVARILRPIASGLDVAHGRGVVHGDVRPSTVLLTPDGTPILAGLGLLTRRFSAPNGADDASAKGLHGSTDSATGTAISRAQQADRRGLALIAYEMLTGRSVEVESSELDDPLPPAHFGSPLLAAPVEQALLRELSGGASERHPNAAAFVADLTAPLRPAPRASITPPPPPVPAAPLVGESGRRLVTVAVILTALAVLGSLALLLRGGDPSRPIAGPARTSVSDTSTGAAIVGPASSTAAGTSAPKPAATSSAPTATPGLSTPGIALVIPPVEVVRPLPSPTIVAAAGASAGGSQSAGPTASAGSRPSVAPPPAPTRVAQASGSGSTRIPVTWRVTGDPSGRWTLGEQGRVTGQTETGASLVLFPESVEDVSYSAQVNTTSCQATLVFRAQDEDNLMMAIYIPDGLPNPTSTRGGVWLYQRVEGQDLPIRAVRPATIQPAGEPVRLKVEASGPDITVSLNDEPAVQAFDTTPKAGRLGMLVYSADGSLCDATFGEIQR